LKKLYLVRHAKSSWGNPELRDLDRPLNDRGKRDAPFMGRLMKQKGIKPGLLITSPAIRAYFTAGFFAAELDYSEDNIVKEEELYEAGVTDIIKVISRVNDDIESIMLFGHNPGLTEFCNYISDKQIDNIPTSAVVSLILKKKHWNETGKKSYRLEFFEYPKKYHK
jgi:phosphohistidine phosphatase